MAYLDQRLIRVALGQQPADVIIENGHLLNVHTREIYPAGVAIAGGRIAAIGDVAYCLGPSTERIDAQGRYLAPGLIDAHVHPEASKITLTRLANAIVPRGTTSIMCSLDQVGAVAGLEGMRFVLDEAARTPLKIFHAAPSRLPYTTPASTVRHPFGPAEYEVAREWPEAVGISEYMVDSIVDDDRAVHAIAEMALERRKGLHGHAPLTRGRALAASAAAGMQDDHESHSAREVVEKLTSGLHVFIRRATHVDDVRACVRAITELGLPARRLALCTDDTDCRDILGLGLIDHLVRYVIAQGVDPVTAIQMGSLHAAEAYRVDHLVGSIAPGRLADILLLDTLAGCAVSAVVANGRLVAREGKMLEPVASPAYPDAFRGTLRLDQPITADDLCLRVDPSARSADVLAIYYNPAEGPLRRRRDVTLPVREGRVLPSPGEGTLYITVVERYTGQGSHSSGFVSGFGLQLGAIATSLAPNDNNIICVGADIDDMAVAVNHLVQVGGGQVAVAGGQVLAEIRLPLLGLMADVSAEEMADAEARLDDAARSLGNRMARPFFHLLFLSITAIPEYGITDQGLVEHASRSVINPVRRVPGGAV